jgi:hypothetical protein
MKMTSEKNDLIRIHVEVEPIRLEPDRDEDRPRGIWVIPLDCCAFERPLFLVPLKPEKDQGDDSL